MSTEKMDRYRKIDAIDLILTALKEHEKKLEEITERLEKLDST